MDKIKKSKWILVRVTPEEKSEVEQIVRENGFDSVSVFVMWAIRKQKASFTPRVPAAPLQVT